MRTCSSLGIASLVACFLVSGFLETPAFSKGKVAPPPPKAAEKSDKVDIKALKCPEGAQVMFLPREAKLVCKDEYRDCETEIKLLAKNCGKEFLEFWKLEMFEQGRKSLVLEFSPASIIPGGSGWQEHIPWTTAGDLEAVVYYRPPGGGSSDSARTEIKVRNVGLDAAKAACEQCKGTWGKYGVNHKEGCNCKTKDADKICHDGDECEGECLFHTYDGQGREVGHCSDQQRMSGCINIVAKGQSKVTPRNPPPRKLPTCLD